MASQDWFERTSTRSSASPRTPTSPRSLKAYHQARPASTTRTRTPVTPWPSSSGRSARPFGAPGPTQREVRRDPPDGGGGTLHPLVGPVPPGTAASRTSSVPSAAVAADSVSRFSTGGDRVSRGMPGGGEPGINDILSQMFGGGAGGRAARSTHRGDDYGDFGGIRRADPWTPARPGPQARTTLSFGAVAGRRSPTDRRGAHHHHSHPRRCPRWAANSLAWQRYAR